MWLTLAAPLTKAEWLSVIIEPFAAFWAICMLHTLGQQFSPRHVLWPENQAHLVVMCEMQHQLICPDPNLAWTVLVEHHQQQWPSHWHLAQPLLPMAACQWNLWPFLLLCSSSRTWLAKVSGFQVSKCNITSFDHHSVVLPCLCDVFCWQRKHHQEWCVVLLLIVTAVLHSFNMTMLYKLLRKNSSHSSASLCRAA